ncbi:MULTISPECIES: ABC transporter permease [unclassified Cytobacillus]|uniref:ABC transporter permease n=1 Tax=unclassified Cytobacillus TaxID=2675268 RepID=UPI0020420083|nr:ABC transporter permease [Cytobacillus sp. AMY 15.2]MCM3093590.1 ABC transporter permease [Cytobacillus sp. AMY 15.2]
MGNLLKFELFKLRKDRAFWTLVFGLIAAAVFYPMLIFFDEAFGTDPVSVKDLYTSTALGGNNYIVRLVPCILAGFFISSEYSIGTMKSMGASGNSRFRLFSAKLFVFSLGAAIISVIFPVVMTGLTAILSGFHDMPDLGFFLRTLGLTILYAAAFSSIMALAASIFTDAGKTIGFLILFFILIDSILYMLGQEFSLFETIYNHSAFKLYLDISEPEFGSGEFLKMLLVPLITYVAAGLIGSFIFLMKEIK